MFRIPSFYTDTVTFDAAWETMKNFGRNDALEGMEAMNRVWEEHCASGNDDDTFWDNYSYEANAFNVVFKNMNELLQPNV
jgi:hypothetical protein